VQLTQLRQANYSLIEGAASALHFNIYFNINIYLT